MVDKKSSQITFDAENLLPCEHSSFELSSSIEQIPGHQSFSIEDLDSLNSDRCTLSEHGNDWQLLEKDSLQIPSIELLYNELEYLAIQKRYMSLMATPMPISLPSQKQHALFRSSMRRTFLFPALFAWSLLQDYSLSTNYQQLTFQSSQSSQEYAKYDIKQSSHSVLQNPETETIGTITQTEDGEDYCSLANI